MPSATIPVNVITGFLGSGKSTLLNALVREPGLTDTAVIVNEFGEIGIDHQLIESAIDQTVLLENGCLCCEVRGDLVDTLEIMEQRIAEGRIPAFRRVILETTGLADPAPILQTVMIEPRLHGRYHLGRVVATADAVNGEESLGAFIEARKQVAVADLVIVTKTDIAEPGRAASLETALRQLNPRAPIEYVVKGQIDARLARLIAGEDIPDAVTAIGRDVAGLGAAPAHDHDHDHHHDHDHDAATGHAGHAHGEHTEGITTAAILLDRPLDWRAFNGWVDAVTSLRGPDLLRVKGLVNVEGRTGPVVVHGVQHVFHPPAELPRWPDDDRRTRIVCITRNIPAESLTRSLEAFALAWQQ